MVVYNTLDNGGLIYKVEIKKSLVKIQEYESHRLLFDIYSDRIFIGKSPKIPMTIFSGGFGPRFNGNSILLKLNADEPLTYMYVGDKIIIFRAKSPIVEYVSPVGNNGVPYPWAVDEDGNYYLMIADVVLLHSKTTLNKKEDPYTYYYRMSLISTDVGRYPPLLPVGGIYKNIEIGLRGEEVMTITYVPHPGENYDRLLNYGDGNIALRMIDGSSTIPLNRDEYIELIDNFGKKRGFEPLDIVRVFSLDDEIEDLSGVVNL